MQWRIDNFVSLPHMILEDRRHQRLGQGPALAHSIAQEIALDIIVGTEDQGTGDNERRGNDQEASPQRNLVTKT